MKKQVLLAAAVLLAFSGAGMAAGFNRSTVPVSACWMIHLDVSGLKGTEAGRSLLANPKIVDSPQLADFTTRFGLDPRRDLRGLTVYAVSTGRLDSVAVLDPDPAAAVRFKAWHEAGGFTAQAYGKHTIYNRSAAEGVPFHAVTADGRIVASLLLENVRQGLDVLDGNNVALPVSAWPALADRKDGAGAIFLLAGRAFGSEMQGVLPQISLLRKANSLCLIIGEKAGQVAAGLSVCADDEAGTDRLQNALLAFVEIGRTLAATDGRPDPVPAVAVTREGKTVRADGLWKTDVLLKMMGGPRAP